jgi:hypothetical protein
LPSLLPSSQHGPGNRSPTGKTNKFAPFHARTPGATGGISVLIQLRLNFDAALLFHALDEPIAAWLSWQWNRQAGRQFEACPMTATGHCEIFGYLSKHAR